jgi:hypothetical protein
MPLSHLYHTPQVHFSTRASSAALASSAASGSPPPRGPTWVSPDLRRGTLTLVAATDNAGAVKLLWAERTGGGEQGRRAGGGLGPPVPSGSLFPSPEEQGDGLNDTSGFELELALSPTTSRFRCD